MEMIKFEMEVLNEYSYAELLKTNEELNKAKTLLIEGREKANYIGDINLAVNFEKQIIRVDENIDTLGVVMLSKEANCFDLRGEFELICLN